MKDNSFRRHGIALFLIVTVLFFILYSPCIFGDKMYGYHDIGRDTKNQYLPNMVYALRSFRTGEVDVYRLDRGIGEYYPSILYKYINGVNLPILLFGEKNLAWGLLGATYLKYLVIALFSWLFFRRLFKHDLISLCCAVVWTYCSYSVVWGQHYHLLTSICAFTIEIYGLQLFLESDKKSFLVIPAFACMAYTGYFYLWMGSFFVLGYSLCYLILKGEKPLAILRKAIVCVLCVIWACLIAGEYMFPGVMEFLESTRGSNIASSGQPTGLFYGSDYLYAFIARLLNPNLLGVGNNYKGPTNYYEIAFTGSGIIFLFSMSVLLLDRQTRSKTAFLLVVCGALLCLPAASKLFSMRATTQRWSFVLQLAETIGIGFGLKRLHEAHDKAAFRKKAFSALLLADVVCCGLVLALMSAQRHAKVALNNVELNKLLLMLLLYNITIVCALQDFPGWQLPSVKFREIIIGLIVAVVSVEVVVVSFPAINDRALITQNNWKNGMYYDGSRTVALRIRRQDDSLYRVSKAYESVSRNDELVQGFNGVAVYNSLNAHWLVNYYVQMGYNISNTDAATGSNYIRFVCRDEAEAGLLGVKYIMRRPEQTGFDLRGYDSIYVNKKGTIEICRNDTISSFGYLYDTQLDYEDMEKYGNEYIKLSMTKGYFDTVDLLAPQPEDDTESEPESDAPPFVFDDESGIGYSSREMLGGPFLGKAYKLKDLDLPEHNIPRRIFITLNPRAQAEVHVKLLAGETAKDKAEVTKTIKASKGRRTYTLDISDIRDIHTISLDSDKSLWFESLQLDYEDADVIADNLRRLYGNGRVELSQSGSCISGRVVNSGTGDEMLCVPVVFNTHWHAKVDGTETGTRNINGGLIGIEVSPGEHTVELTYRDPVPMLGRIVGLISFALYMVFIAIVHLRRRRESAWVMETESPFEFEEA